MRTYKEYRALMLKDGKWQSFSLKFTNKDDCMRWIQGKVKQYSACRIPLPEKWQIQYREVTVTDWIEYA